jgi:methionyl-tRNA formyltransferase
MFLSRGKWGPSLLRWLEGQSCHVVYSDTDNRPVEKFPDYDLGLAFLYGHRIPASELDGRKLWINFHSAPLPEFRGRNIAFHAIMQGATHFGATIHYMDASLDTGPLIEVQRFPIKPRHTAGDLALRSHRLLLHLFRKHVPALLQGDLPSTPQTGGAYYAAEDLPIHIELDHSQQLLLRALTVHPLFHAKVRAGGRSYRIIPES